ncbi:tetratricopeptide repeat protein [Aquiflexum sp.]|uniref:tetratricopeptide repeat protein n=1 Tax=Aquiflexum sp. TaxID=1872584 RepID=UPI003593D74C
MLKAERTINSEPDSSYFFAIKALELGKETEDNLLLARIHHLLGKLLYFKGIYAESANNLLLVEELLLKEEFDPLLIDNYNFRGKIAYKTQKLDDALSLHQKAFDLTEKINDEIRKAISIGLIGFIYEKRQEYQKALKHQWTAISIFKKLKRDDLSAEINENLGSIYEDLEIFDSASYYFQKALGLKIESGDSLNMISTLNNLGDIYRKNGEIEQGLEITNEALALSRVLDQPYEESSALRDLARSYFELKDFQKAYNYLDSSRIVYREIYNKETATQMALMEELFLIKLKDQQIIELEQLKAFDAKIRILFVVVILLLIGTSWLIISKKNIKSKVERQLLESEKEIMLTQQKLMKTELYNIQLKDETISKELESNAKSLTAQTLHVIDKNKMLEVIRQRLQDSLEKDTREQKKNIRNLVKMIDYNFVQDTDWNDFKKNFEKAHKNFFQNLHHQAVDLTPSELRLASLMRMNLSSKDIASTLNISPDSLRISRYRLRKKLALGKGESLQQFILSI